MSDSYRSSRHRRSPSPSPDDAIAHFSTSRFHASNARRRPDEVYDLRERRRDPHGRDDYHTTDRSPAPTPRGDEARRGRSISRHEDDVEDDDYEENEDEGDDDRASGARRRPDEAYELRERRRDSRSRYDCHTTNRRPAPDPHGDEARRGRSIIRYDDNEDVAEEVEAETEDDDRVPLIDPRQERYHRRPANDGREVLPPRKAPPPDKGERERSFPAYADPLPSREREGPARVYEDEKRSSTGSRHNNSKSSGSSRPRKKHHKSARPQYTSAAVIQARAERWKDSKGSDEQPKKKKDPYYDPHRANYERLRAQGCGRLRAWIQT